MGVVLGVQAEPQRHVHAQIGATLPRNQVGRRRSIRRGWQPVDGADKRADRRRSLVRNLRAQTVSLLVDRVAERFLGFHAPLSGLGAAVGCVEPGRLPIFAGRDASGELLTIKRFPNYRAPGYGTLPVRAHTDGHAMESKRFDALTRTLHSRRGVMQTVVGLGAGLGLARSAAARTTRGGGSRFGCTTRDNSCGANSGAGVPCPGAQSGSGAFCVKNCKGKPLCAANGLCVTCKRNADCHGLNPAAQCIKNCPICQKQGVNSLCILALRAAPAG
ncbi:MAG TPA: hypothetical protein VFU81_20530 [Thermomicrobiales bacterium]|nr:hypothetical protein [Thermomicrobiales bacterium]